MCLCICNFCSLCSLQQVDTSPSCIHGADIVSKGIVNYYIGEFSVGSSNSLRNCHTLSFHMSYQAIIWMLVHGDWPSETGHLSRTRGTPGMLLWSCMLHQACIQGFQIRDQVCPMRDILGPMPFREANPIEIVENWQSQWGPCDRWIYHHQKHTR